MLELNKLDLSTTIFERSVDSIPAVKLVDLFLFRRQQEKDVEIFTGQEILQPRILVEVLAGKRGESIAVMDMDIAGSGRDRSNPRTRQLTLWCS